MSEETPRAEVIRMIHDAVAKKRTTTFYIRTDKNRMVMLGIKQGEIVTLSSGPKRGENAVPILREMTSGVVRSEDAAVAFHSDQMPPTGALLAMIEATDVGSDGLHRAAQGTPSPPTGAGMEKEAAQTILCQLLAKYMGPIAPMVCKDAFDNLGDSVDAPQLWTAIETLAAEIDNDIEAKEFSRLAAQQLKLSI